MALSSNSPFQRIKKPLKSDMNVVPYIDVMLVLLVIFMVTAPMLTTGLTVDLPDAPTEAIAVSQQQPAIVSVKAGGALFLRVGDGDDDAIDLDTLQNKLTVLQQQNPQLMVLINGDQAVPYGDVVSLMARLQQSGLRQVGLLTEIPTAR